MCLMGTTESARFKQGMVAGVGATLAAGAISLLLLVLHLWPGDRPLSVMVTRMVLHQRMGVGLSPTALYLIAGTGQLIYGALCGGLLAFLVAPITVAGAFGMGALRWSVTQVLVAPALGWGDFGVFGRPWIGVYTLLPHLAFTLVAVWLLRQEESERAPLWSHLPRQFQVVHVPRRLRHPFTSGRGTRRR
jgi:hypothetical protein